MFDDITQKQNAQSQVQHGQQNGAGSSMQSRGATLNSGKLTDEESGHSDDIFAEDLDMPSAMRKTASKQNTNLSVPQPAQGQPTDFQALDGYGNDQPGSDEKYGGDDDLKRGGYSEQATSSASSAGDAPPVFQGSVGGLNNKQGHFYSSVAQEAMRPFPFRALGRGFQPSQYKLRKWTVFLLVQIIFILLIVAGILTYQMLTEGSESSFPSKNSQRNDPSAGKSYKNGVFNNSKEAEKKFNKGELSAEKPILDTDDDGVSDEEELALGTNPRVTDTDFDELDDFAELKVYKTNPMMKDTDGDGFLDGVEVKTGFDPSDKGKKLK